MPDALITPTTSGITKAEENTGPRNPTDWAMTSGSDSSFAPRRSYDPESDDSELAIGFSFIFITTVPGQPAIRSTLLALPAKIASVSACGRPSASMSAMVSATTVGPPSGMSVPNSM